MQRGNGNDVVLQAFHWNLVKTRGTGTIDGRDQSWYAILGNWRRISPRRDSPWCICPVLARDSDWEHGGRHGGGEGYFWHDLILIPYGTAQELKELVADLHALGIRVIVDLVTNHRDRFRMQRDIWEYPGPCWARSSRDTGGTFMDGSCDLNLAEPVVHTRFRQAWTSYGCVRIDGWRWDYVWGYEVEQCSVVDTRHARREYISIGNTGRTHPI
jgi:alpha-amylase